jgi:hypothetical protein
MPSYGGPAVPSPALDFLAVVRGKEHTPGGSSAYAILEDDDRATLDRLLARYGSEGATSALERSARSFLLTYRELDKHAGVLEKSERERLDQILDEPQRSTSRRIRIPFYWPQTKLGVNVATLVAFIIIVIVGVGGGLAVRTLVTTLQSGPPPGTTQQHPPAQQVAPGTTDLQNLKQDWGPWNQVEPSDQRPQTGQPALLLLEGGGYFASTKWTVSPDAQGWQQDIAGNIDNVDVNGNHADITDADGNPYIVGINQPFIVSSNPGTVLRVDATGNVLSMSLAQATAVRHSLNGK